MEWQPVRFMNSHRSLQTAFMLPLVDGSEILHPLIFTHNLQGVLHPNGGWGPLGFLKHQQLNVRLVVFLSGKKCRPSHQMRLPRGRGQGSFKTPSIRSTRIALDLSVSWWATMTTLPKFNSEFTPEKLPKPNRKGSSSKHHFSGASC